MTERPRLLRWTRFKSDHSGTGPDKRSAQIRELVLEAGFEVDDMMPPQQFSRLEARLRGLAARWNFGPTASVDRAGPGLLGYRTIFYRRALAAHNGARVLLWETTYDDLLPALAVAAGYRVIALPHNLEALVSDAVFRDPSYDPTADLVGEVRRLRRAQNVFTISREEQWFLETRGLTPGYLPFFPTGSLAADCAAIREERLAREKSDASRRSLLLLGSAFNPATGRGMQWQLDQLRSLGGTMPTIKVAGPDTDRLFAHYASPRTEILGRISRDHLRELLVECSALLVHTQGGAGAVTRIPEALAAGIPVIANVNAARDQHDANGVHVYTDASSFHTLVLNPLPMPPPLRATQPHARPFQARLQEIIALSRHV